jgi:hypothetical protein
MDDQLSNDHAVLGKLLGEVLDALEAGDVTASHSRLDLFWARLAMHIRAEHLHLFPAILRNAKDTSGVNTGAVLSQPEILSAIEQLRSDHDFFMHELGGAMETMRELLASKDRPSTERDLKPVRARVVAIAERLATHNTLEESHVYLWTNTLLTKDEQQELEMLVHGELGNLPPRFKER